MNIFEIAKRLLGFLTYLFARLNPFIFIDRWLLKHTPILWRLRIVHAVWYTTLFWVLIWVWSMKFEPKLTGPLSPSELFVTEAWFLILVGLVLAIWVVFMGMWRLREAKMGSKLLSFFIIFITIHSAMLAPHVFGQHAIQKVAQSTEQGFGNYHDLLKRTHYGMCLPPNLSETDLNDLRSLAQKFGLSTELVKRSIYFGDPWIENRWKQEIERYNLPSADVCLNYLAFSGEFYDVNVIKILNPFLLIYRFDAMKSTRDRYEEIKSRAFYEFGSFGAFSIAFSFLISIFVFVTTISLSPNPNRDTFTQKLSRSHYRFQYRSSNLIKFDPEKWILKKIKLRKFILVLFLISLSWFAVEDIKIFGFQIGEFLNLILIFIGPFLIVLLGNRYRRSFMSKHDSEKSLKFAILLDFVFIFTLYFVLLFLLNINPDFDGGAAFLPMLAFLGFSVVPAIYISNFDSNDSFISAIVIFVSFSIVFIDLLGDQIEMNFKFSFLFCFSFFVIFFVLMNIRQFKFKLTTVMLFSYTSMLPIIHAVFSALENSKTFFNFVAIISQDEDANALIFSLAIYILVVTLCFWTYANKPFRELIYRNAAPKG